MASALACVLICPVVMAQTTVEPPLQQLRTQFAQPPANVRPMMRWWWFGPAVRNEELARELDAMHAAGIGGVELATVYPLALDDLSKRIENLRYGSPAHVNAISFAARHARSLGMRVDFTLGSGWPFGGPEIPLSLAAGSLKIVAVPLPSPASARPTLAEGDSFLADFVASGTPEHYDAAGAQQLPDRELPSALAAPLAASGIGSGNPAARPSVELFFMASHTRQQVKRAAFGAEGFVLDHMARPAIEQHLRTVAEPLLSGFAQQPPYAIFSDSLEVYGSDWTPALPEEFRRRRGYDLIAHLPELAQGGTPQADAVRHDWGVTLSELVDENYLRPVAEYAKAHGTRFRSQTYGEPAATLGDEAIAQLPEGEGLQWRAFSFTRWASSANHVYGNPVTSAETWTWLHSPAFRATPLDMKAEADRMFLEGVNQIIGHGFPYSAPEVAEPGWSLYAAAALNAHNPWWPVMPQITTYLTRVSWALRLGQPANDVAILLPEDDARAAFRPGLVSVTTEMAKRITPALMGAILDAGYNIDYIDLTAAGACGLHYPVVVVPPTTRIPLSGVQALQAYVHGGGKLIFLGEIPTEAAGLADAHDAAAVRAGIAALQSSATHISAERELPEALHRALPPDVSLNGVETKVGFLHRRMQGADLYFFANTSPEPVSWTVKVRAQHAIAEWWDPNDGEATHADLAQPLQLAPYGSCILLVHDRDGKSPELHASPRLVATAQPSIQLQDWTIRFPGSPGSTPQATVQHASDTVWTNTPATRFYSGAAIYTTSFQTHLLAAGEHLTLTFAAGKPLPDTQAPGKPGMRAWFDPPIREAALVFVNGQPAGALWHPPYTLDLSAALRGGQRGEQNTLEIRVFNTAINELAGQPPRDYTALKARYGERFQMQDMENLQPVPSGIEGEVKLVYSREQPPAPPPAKHQPHTQLPGPKRN